MAADKQVIGSIVSLWRYPVKSMQGEELNASAVGERGLLGDRVYALVDAATNRVVSAKNPRKWPNMFELRAAFGAPLPGNGALPPVWITLPDGSFLSTEQEDRDRILSTALGRPVVLRQSAPDRPMLEEYWPQIEGLPHQDQVTDEEMPPGSFFDFAPIHLLTTATLEHLRELDPPGRFEVRRFRPNIVVSLASQEKGFLEQDWVGRTVCLGQEVRLQILKPCPRCVMTTLPQADLPRDPSILRTAVQHNQGHVGVYASVLRGGTLRRGDPIWLE